MRIDLHTHSSVSDGTDAPADLVRAAAAAGLDVLGLCDHDTFDGLDEARAAASGAGVVVVAGLEMSTELAGASVHLLGYGCRVDDPDLAAELARIRAGRTGRLPALVARLGELGLPLTEAEVQVQSHGSPSPGRPHVADAMVARGYVADRTEAFDRWLADDRPAYVPRYAADVAASIALVHRAGGVAVLAHPWGRGSRAVLPPAVLADLVAQHGLDGLEVDHTDHDAPTRAELRALASGLGVLVTGSSDHHGAGKPGNPLGCETTDPAVYERLLGLVAARGGTA